MMLKSICLCEISFYLFIYFLKERKKEMNTFIQQGCINFIKGVTVKTILSKYCGYTLL